MYARNRKNTGTRANSRVLPRALSLPLDLLLLGSLLALLLRMGAGAG